METVKLDQYMVKDGRRIDMFAAFAMQSILVKYPSLQADEVAANSWRMAQTMIAAEPSVAEVK